MQMRASEAHERLKELQAYADRKKSDPEWMDSQDAISTFGTIGAIGFALAEGEDEYGFVNVPGVR